MDSTAEIKKLPRRILRAIEIEFEILKETVSVDDAGKITEMYKRIRRQVLDAVGDCVRKTEEDTYL